MNPLSLPPRANTLGLQDIATFAERVTQGNATAVMNMVQGDNGPALLKVRYLARAELC